MMHRHIAVWLAVIGLVSCMISPSAAVVLPDQPPIILLLQGQLVTLDADDFVVLDTGEVVITPGSAGAFQQGSDFDANVTTQQCKKGGGIVVKKCGFFCLVLYEACQGGDHNGEKIIDF